MKTDAYQNHRRNVSKIVGGHVKLELDRQHAKWGDQYHAAPTWLGIIMEEIGEVAKAVIEYTDPTEEIIQAIACLVQLYAAYTGTEEAREILRAAEVPAEYIR